MTKIIFYEWQPGLNKVGFYRLLRTELGYSLSTAKHAVEMLMEGEILEVEVISPEIAEKVLREAKQLGAVGKKVNILKENLLPESTYHHLGKLETVLSQLLEEMFVKKLEQLTSSKALLSNTEFNKIGTTSNMI